MPDMTDEASSNSSDFDEPNEDSESGSEQAPEPAGRGGGKDLERLRQIYLNSNADETLEKHKRKNQKKEMAQATTRKMTTRAGNKHKNEEPLKIVRDAKQLQSSQPENVRTAQMMTDFGKKTIVTPDAQEQRKGYKTPPQQEPRSDTTMADSESEKPSPLEQAMRIGQELYGFNHCKIRDDKKVFKYEPRPLDKLGVERDRVVPSHYIKHAELVLPENQTTYEKNWSYHRPLYEITEEMK